MAPRTRAAAALLVVVSGLSAVSLAHALVPPFDVPWTERSPAYDAERDIVACVALGTPDPRLLRLAAARVSGRRRGEARAREALHAYVDDALARVRARPDVAARVHAALDDAARVVGVRGRADGGAMVVVEVDARRLRSAARLRGVPWAS